MSFKQICRSNVQVACFDFRVRGVYKRPNLEIEKRAMFVAMPNKTVMVIHTSKRTSGFVDLMPCSKARHGLYPMSASVVKGPHATIIEQADWDDEGSSLGFIIPCAAGDALRVGICALS